MNSKKAKILRGHCGGRDALLRGGDNQARRHYQAAKRGLVMAPTRAAQQPTTCPVALQPKVRARKAIPPTWPLTANQKRQSRPVIVLGIVQVLKAAGVGETRQQQMRDRGHRWPKHALDAKALEILSGRD